MVEGFSVGDEPGLDEFPASVPEEFLIHGQASAEGGVGVVAQALRVGNGHQEKVECRRRMTQPIDRALTDQALIHPAELGGDPAQALSTEGMLLNHDRLLCLEGGC